MAPLFLSTFAHFTVESTSKKCYDASDLPLLIIHLQSEVPKQAVVVPEVEAVPVVVADEVDSAHEAALADEEVLEVVLVGGAVSALEVVVRPGVGEVSGEEDNKVYQEDRCDRFSFFRFLWICTCTFIFDPVMMLTWQGWGIMVGRAIYHYCMSANYHSMLLAPQ